MEDRKIIKLLFERSEQALTALAEKFGKGLLAAAMNITGDAQDAEECVNDTYLALWNAIPPETPDLLSAYAHRVLRNTACNRLRKVTAQKRRAAYDLSVDELSAYLGESSLEAALDARTLGDAIDCFLSTLSKENHVLFLRRYWFGDSAADAARIMGISENTANVRLSRIRKKLKDYLIQEDLL